MQIFRISPVPLAVWQRWMVGVTALLVAVTRLLALSRSFWDWDEAQFIGALREYDVALHHPHPPGFPLFVLAAHAARFVTATDFEAVRLVSLVAACFLFPLAFLLAREMRFGFAVAFAGALLFVFFPNVWFYGGTGFSDIAAVAVLLAAIAMLLRGCRSDRAFLAGAFLLGCAAGFRPQSLLFGVAPFLLAIRFQFPRSWRRVSGAGLIVFAVVVVSYTGAILASASLERYQMAVTGLSEWIRTHDSAGAAGRPALLTLLDDYVVTPMPGGRLGAGVSIAAAIGLAAGLFRRRPAALLAALTFGPFMVFAWLTLDINSIHRYSTAYLFLHAFLAAEGVAFLALPLRRFAAPLSVVILVAVAARYAWWTWPALSEVRTSDSPPHAAFAYVAALSPRHVWVNGALRPASEAGLPAAIARTLVNELEELPMQGAAVRELYVAEGALAGGATKTFVRPPGRIWEIARHRYFQVSVAPLWSLVHFGEGWYGEEGQPGESWRWMPKEASITLPSWPGRGRLRLRLQAQNVVSPTVELRFNGELVETLRCTPAGVVVDRLLPSRQDGTNQLTITADRTVNLQALGIADDGRDLSVRLDSCSWMPVP